LIAAFPVERRKVFGVPLRWALVGAAAACCAALGGAVASSPELGRFYGASGSDGAYLYVQTTRLIDPPIAHLKWLFFGHGNSIGGSGGIVRGSADLHNRLTHSFYGYEYTLEPAGDGKYKVSFSPLRPSTLKRRMGPYKMDGNLVAPPQLPAPQVVPVGQPFEVTLYQSGGERVYDRIVLSRTPFPDWPPKQPQSAQDGRMRLAGPQLYVNRQLVASQHDAGSGPVIWVHLPGQGRFLVALDPQGNSRFTEAGHVSGNAIEFQSEGTKFRIVCAEPVVTGGDRPVFVYHQQSFEDSLDPDQPLTKQPFVGNAGPASLFQD
jgi:hypothetical protein